MTDKVKENHIEETESGVFHSGHIMNRVGGVKATIPQQFEALKQQKDLWEQGINMYLISLSFFSSLCDFFLLLPVICLNMWFQTGLVC